MNNEVSKAVAYPDRLVRFGFEMVEELNLGSVEVFLRLSGAV